MSTADLAPPVFRNEDGDEPDPIPDPSAFAAGEASFVASVWR